MASEILTLIKSTEQAARTDIAEAKNAADKLISQAKQAAENDYAELLHTLKAQAEKELNELKNSLAKASEVKRAEVREKSTEFGRAALDKRDTISDLLIKEILS